MSGPKLSIVVASRNDDHGNDLLLHMEMFLHTFCREAERYRAFAEIIFVEWNPPGDREPLAQAIEWPATQKTRFRVITVPKEAHRQLAHHKVIPLYQMIAKNVGIRRAEGQYILCTNPDLIFPPALVEWLATARLEANAFYRATRHDLDVSKVPFLTSESLMEFCQEHTARTHDRPKKAPGPHTNACGDFTLMARDDWFALGAYLEYQAWSPHIDSILLFMAQARGMEEMALPWPIYHMKHKGSWSEEPNLELPQLAIKEVRALRECIEGLSGPFIRNPPGWGMEHVALPERVIKPPKEAPAAYKRLNPTFGLAGPITPEMPDWQIGEHWTLFSVPHPFVGAHERKQRRALESWARLEPRPEIVLMGKDPTVAEAAREYNCRHVAHVEMNANTTPYLNFAFEAAQNCAWHAHCCYVNSDIILPPGFIATLEAVSREMDDVFLVTGLRWDCDLDGYEIDFKRGWHERLVEHVRATGRFHELTGADYFAFPRGMYKEIPPYLIGRTAWDNWLIMHCVRQGIPVVDATHAVFLVHQDVGSSAQAEGRAETPGWKDECYWNATLWAREKPQYLEGSIETANWRVSADGKVMRV